MNGLPYDIRSAGKEPEDYLEKCAFVALMQASTTPRFDAAPAGISH